MSKLEKVTATAATALALGAGIGAYKYHEEAGSISKTASAQHFDQATKAEFKNLENLEDQRSIILLGGAGLLGLLGTGAALSARNDRRPKVRKS